MDREEAKLEIKRRWEDVLQLITQPAAQKVNNHTSYICPLCGHGAHGDGLTFIPNSRSYGLKCFGCNFGDGKEGNDIIALFMQLNNCDFKKALEDLADLLQIPLDPLKEKTAKNDAGAAKSERPIVTPSKEEKTAQNENMPPADYSAYYEKCRARLNDPAAVAYLEARGLSLETAAAFGVGYDPEADPAGSGYKTPRLILPASNSFYAARALDPANQYRYLNSNKEVEVKNAGLLYDPNMEAVFIVEGTIDAMAIYEAGGQAIALNSTSNKNILIKMLQARKTAATLLLALDNDDGGRKATAALKAALKQLKVNFEEVNITCGYKDPGEALQENRAAFIEAVENAMREGKARPDNTADYLERRLTDCEAYRQKIQTGFKNLDEKMGGLRPALYVLAAISSLGKTTFCHQIAENVAAAGQHVLFFSMEQSANELVSKSLQRIIRARSKNSNITTLQIMEGSRDFSVTDAEAVYKNTIGPNLSIIEANLDCDIEVISRKIKRYIARNNCRPLVVVDYLQILQPAVDKVGRRQTTKETVDLTTTELKRLSRALKIPILAISSVNRMNYTLPVDFESLKESGNIEFTADVVLGLQLHCLEVDPVFTWEKITPKRERVKEAKAANPRELDLICLKNRFGISSFTCNFKYYTDCDTFAPWIMTLQERMAEAQAAEAAREAATGRGRKKKEGEEEKRLDPAILPPWQLIMQPKQTALFNTLQGKLLDTNGEEIELTYTIVKGKKWPAINCGDNSQEILSEERYKEIVEYNLTHGRPQASIMNALGEEYTPPPEPGKYPF